MTSGRLYKATAIVLARKNTGEADRIIIIFTKEYGKLRVLAKGIRRVSSRRAPHVEIFSMAEIMLHRGKTNLDIVGEISPIETFQNLRKDLSQVSWAYYFCELVDRLVPERVEHEDIFKLLSSYLSRLNEEKFDAKKANEFSLELLRLTGFLGKNKNLPPEETEKYIENIIERRLRTPKIMDRIKA